MQFIIPAFATLLAVGVQASWCNYYYDAQCQQDANGGTSFDCANHGIIGSGGRYVACHGTANNQQACTVARCNDNVCSQTLQSTSVAANGDCIDMGGAGPWYEERFT